MTTPMPVAEGRHAFRRRSHRHTRGLTQTAFNLWRMHIELRAQQEQPLHRRRAEP